MKPLNIEERRKAFVQYLLMYLVSTALVVYAICFVCGVPDKQNQLLLEKNEKLNAVINAPEKYKSEINDLSFVVNALDTNDVRTLKLKIDELSSKLSSFKEKIKNDSSLANNIILDRYLSSIEQLYKLSDDKKSNLEFNKNSEAVKKNFENWQSYALDLENIIAKNSLDNPYRRPIIIPSGN